MSGTNPKSTSTITTFYSSFPYSSSSSSANFAYQKLTFNSFSPVSTITSQPSLLKPQCLFILLPSEIFINICQFLTPWDLATISLVCRKFRDYLTCPISSTTMDIWRTSRINAIFFPQLPPPEGLNEREYCKIAMLEKGCQFCVEKSHNVRIYWTFRVRSCWDCLMARIECIPQGQSVPDFAAGLPYETFRVHGIFGPEYKVFWESDFKLAEIEFSKVRESERTKWMEEKIAKCEYLMTDALNRGKADQDSKEIHNQAKRIKINSFFCLMMLETYTDYQLDPSLTSKLKAYNVRESIYSPYILGLCPTYNETIALPNHLFVRVTFKSWRDKMRQDYKQIEMKYSIPMRYNQINQKLLCTQWFFGPLYYWIVHCETYISPPYINNDPRNSWSEEFLDKYIIPKILCEAIECERKANDAKIALQLVENLIFQKVVNLNTAIAFGLGGDDDGKDELNECNDYNNGLEIFQCKICKESTNNYLLYSYRGIKKHLQRHSSFHEIELGDYIELDYKIMHNFFKNCSNNWFETGIYPYKLPEDIMQILNFHRMPWWKNQINYIF